LAIRGRLSALDDLAPTHPELPLVAFSKGSQSRRHGIESGLLPNSQPSQLRDRGVGDVSVLRVLGIVVSLKVCDLLLCPIREDLVSDHAYGRRARGDGHGDHREPHRCLRMMYGATSPRALTRAPTDG
jgi:hypothetical protein